MMLLFDSGYETKNACPQLQLEIQKNQDHNSEVLDRIRLEW